MEFRAYRPSDLDAMVALDDVCFEAPFRFSRAVMRSFAEAKRASVVIAADGDELAGFAILHVEGDIGYVVTLDVAPKQRRAGLATRLMGELASQALSAGCSAMLLHVYPENHAAVRFYERLGFVQETKVAGFYGDGLDALVYRRKLV